MPGAAVFFFSLIISLTERELFDLGLNPIILWNK